MTQERIDEVLSVIRRASGLLLDDLTYQVLARPSRRPPQFSDPAWTRRPVTEQVDDARRCLKSFVKGDEPGLALAALFLSAAVCLRGGQRSKKK